MLCLVQAGAPGTPFIYAPALAMMNPRSGGYSGGAIEGELYVSHKGARHQGIDV
jgi:hypothetical protein